MAKKKVSTEDLQEAGSFGVAAGEGVTFGEQYAKRPRRICLTLSEDLSQAIREGSAELGISISAVVADMEGDHWQRAAFGHILAAEAERQIESRKRFLSPPVVSAGPNLYAPVESGEVGVEP